MSHVLVVCARRFNGHELFTLLGTLQHRGHTFEVVSTATVVCDEITFRPNRLKRTIDEVTDEEAEAFDAIAMVSGNMQDTEAYWTNRRVQGFVDVVDSQSKPVAAICCSVPAIRHVARDKAVSFFPLLRSRQLLTDAGAVLRTVALTRDRNLVTAEHQMASQMWAEELCNMLEGKPVQYHLVDSGYTPGIRPRKPIPEVEAIKARRNRRSVTPERLEQKDVEKTSP